MKKSLLGIFLSLFVLTLFAFKAPTPETKGYKITAKITGIKDTTVLLAYYYGGKQYIKDTFDVDSKGVAVMTGDEALPGGIYLVVLPDKRWVEFLVTGQEFSLETQTSDLIGNMKFKGSEDNRQFYEYLQFVEGKKAAADALNKEKEALSKEKKDTKEVDEKLKQVDKDVITFRDEFIAKYPNNFAAKVFKAAKDPVVPEAPKKEDGSPVDSNFTFHYYQQHYFDEVDFQDARMLYTPILQQKVNFYIDKLTYQEPDSLIKSVKYIMDKVEGNEEMFKYWVIYFTNKYAKDKRMCFEKVYVYMGEQYYLTNRATWVDSTQLAKITDRILKMKYNQCGMKAANLRLMDHSGRQMQLYEVQAPYTVLYFWDYDCGHCKKTTPVLKEFYEKYKANGVEVLGICTREDTAKWNDYIHEHELKWKNAIDLEGKSYFRVYYDIYSTPVIYLLDKDKVIKAKRLDVPGLEDFIRFELGLPPIKSSFPSEEELEKEKSEDEEH